MSLNASNGDNLLLGRGKVYFNRLVDGLPTGERYLGDCDIFEVTNTPETRDRYTYADRSSALLKRAIIRQLFEFGIQMAEYDADNVALALLGTKATVTQDGETVAGGTVNGGVAVVGGYWYDLGEATTAGVTPRNITGFTLSVGTVDTDFTLDAVNGRIYIIPGGAADGQIVTASFTVADATFLKVIAGTEPLIEGALRFIGDAVVGPNYDVQVWKVQISPDGAMGLISDDYGTPKLKGAVLKDEVNHPTEPYFTAVPIDSYEAA